MLKEYIMKHGNLEPEEKVLMDVKCYEDDKEIDCKELQDDFGDEIESELEFLNMIDSN